VAGQDHAQDRAEAEHVGPRVDLLDHSRGLFGRHERRRAHHRALLGVLGVRGPDAGLRDRRLRAPRLGLGRRVARRLARGGRARAREVLRQPPVHHLHFGERPDHHVRGLQVAVNDPVGVRVPDALTDLLEDGDEPAALGARRRALAQERVEGAPEDQLHGEERAAVGERADLVNRRNRRVLELPRNERFFDEPPGRGAAGPEPLAQQLHRDLPVHGEVPRAVHQPHAAMPDLFEQLVAGRRRGARAGAGERAVRQPGGVVERGGRHGTLALDGGERVGRVVVGRFRHGASSTGVAPIIPAPAGAFE